MGDVTDNLDIALQFHSMDLVVFQFVFVKEQVVFFMQGPKFMISSCSVRKFVRKEMNPLDMT